MTQVEEIDPSRSPARPDGVGIIRGLIRLGEALSSTLPLTDRMTKVCEETVLALGCDRSSIFILKGNYFHAAYNFGNPPDIAELFFEFRVRKTDAVIAEAFESGTFLRINNAREDPRTVRLADAARIGSCVIAPMTDSKGQPMAFMTAEFNESPGVFDDLSAEVVLGAARVAQGAMITARERLRRMRAGRVQRELLERLVSAEDRERRRISADIHDDSLQRVTALMHELEVASFRAPDDETREMLTGLADRAADASKSLRDFVQDVHPLSVDAGGLAGAIDTLLERLGALNGWETSLTDNTTDEIPPTAVAVLYRVARQAIENVELHARAGRVDVTIETIDGTSCLTIVDDGRGFDPEQVKHDRYGVLMMGERAEFADGTFELTSAPGDGTKVFVCVPLK